MSFSIREFLRVNPLSLMATSSSIYKHMSNYTDDFKVAMFSSVIASILFEASRQKMILDYEIYSKVSTHKRILNVFDTYGLSSWQYIGA